jgi:hypothetical protein
VWRVGPDGAWSAVDRGVFPLPAVLAAPLGSTAGALVLRSRGPELALEVVGEDGSVRSVHLPTTEYFGSTSRAFASDAGAQRIILGSDWTTTGGRSWHVEAARATSTISGVVYATRDGPAGSGRSSLWRRTGAQPWKRVANIAGRSCRPVAGPAQRVYVLCADSLWRSDDGGRSDLVVAVPQPLRDALSLAVDGRRPDRIALLFRTETPACGNQDITITSADGGATWQPVDAACSRPAYEALTIAPDGDLVRWSRMSPQAVPQVLDGWR